MAVDPKSLIDAVESINVKNEDDLLAYAPDIAEMVDYWEQTDDLVEGYDKVKAAGTKYLPRFVEEETDDYNVRLEYSKYTNVYRDIVEGLSAKPFEEEISLVGDDIPTEMKEFIENVDGAGNNISVFGAHTFFNGINSALDWIFIDYPTVDPVVIRSKEDEKKAGLAPFWTHVLASNVREVRTQVVNRKRFISYIRIFEPGINALDRVRIFERVGSVVTWEIWEKIENTATQALRSQYRRIDNGVLSIDEIPLVPFITGRRDGTKWKFFPAMRDAADLQVKLYQEESGLQFIATMAAYPMLAANGLRPQYEADGKTPRKIRRGPLVVLYGIPDGQGNHGEWGYIEPAATSMEFLQKKIEKTKEDLRELGRQPLTATSGNLTVITTAVAAGKSRSAVSAWALALKDTLENALVITNKYNKLNYDPQVNVYNEFDNFAEGDKDIDALRAARDKGDLSRETYWFELKRRKVLSPEFDKDEELKALLEEIPSDENIDLEDDDDKGGL